MRCATGSKTHDWVGDAVGDTIIKAADGPAVVDHAERLAALVNADAFDGLAVREFSGEGTVVNKLR